MTKINDMTVEAKDVYFPVNGKGDRKPRFHSIDIEALGSEGKALYAAKVEADKVSKEAREAFEAFASKVYGNPESKFELDGTEYPFVPEGMEPAFAYRFGPQVFASEPKAKTAAKAKSTGSTLVLPTAAKTEAKAPASKPVAKTAKTA